MYANMDVYRKGGSIMKVFRSMSLFSLCMMLVCAMLPTNVFAAEGNVKIDDATFPDENFREVVQKFVGAEDGVFTPEEIFNIKNINCNSTKIADLTGIENFTALTKLTINHTKVKTLDLSGNKMLKDVDCSNNELEELNIRENSALTNLWCEGNQLKSLDVSNNSNLQVLYCHTNDLTSLDASNLRSLKKLDCSHNRLKSLDVSNDKALTHLWTHLNNLPSIDVSSNPALSVLWSYGNPIKTIDVSKNAKLTSLDCSQNGLSTVDVSNNKSLNYLKCQKNQITALDVTNNPSLKGLTCYGNQLTELDLTKNTGLTALDCHDNQLTELNLDANKKLEDIYCNNNEIKTLDASNKKSLSDLDCSNNQLTELTVENNKLMKTLLCQDNALPTLDLTTTTSLRKLDCKNNELTSLNLEKNTALNILDCSGNELVALDLNTNRNLKYLTCEDNSRFVQNGASVSELPNFDPTKVVDMNGGNFQEDKVNFTDQRFTYTYDSGNGFTTAFTLVNDAIEGLRPVKMSATLNDKIGMNIYLEASKSVLMDDQAYVEFKVTDKDKVISKKFYVNDFKKEKGLYKVTMPLVARQMNDVVTMDVYTTKADGVVSKDESYTYSIVNYAKTVLEEPNAKPEEVAVIEAMLNYGAMAQVYFDYNTDSLANASITNKAYEDVNASRLQDYASTVTGEVAGIEYGKTNLRLLSQTAIRHHFVVNQDVQDLYNAGTIKFIQVMDDEEKELNPTFYGKDKVYVELENLYAEDFDQPYTVKVVNTETKDELTIVYSVFSYAKDVLTKSTNEDLANLVKAMVVYNQTAKAYRDSL